jgi:hypothetical protein
LCVLDYENTSKYLSGCNPDILLPSLEWDETKFIFFSALLHFFLASFKQKIFGLSLYFW